MLVSRRAPGEFTTNGRLMLQNFVDEPAMAEYGSQYHRLGGMQEALERLQGSEGWVDVDPVTFNLLHQLAEVEWLPRQVLERFRRVARSHAKHQHDSEL